MSKEITLRICQDALISPISNLRAWFLKVDLPDGAQHINGASPHGITISREHILERDGFDIMPLVMDEIRRHANNGSPRKASPPAELLEMVK